MYQGRHTEKTDGSNDLGGINAKLLKDGVDNGVERGGQGSTAEDRLNTLGVALHQATILGHSENHAGTDEGEDGEDGESHSDGLVGRWFGEERGCSL